MLDYIVERKRMDDLSGSIIDGRFHEQKVVKLFLTYAYIRFISDILRVGCL